MNREIQFLLKSRAKPFKKDDIALFKKAKYDLCKDIRDFKTSWKLNSIKQMSDDCGKA